MIIDEKRLERQRLSVSKWINNKGMGFLSLAPGFGKTMCAVIAIKTVLSKKPDGNILVVVPTIVLQDQWIKVLKVHKLNVRVLVLKSASKVIEEVDLLVIDEAHLSFSEEYIKIYDNITYKTFLGLTGTIERSDGKEKLILSRIPIVDTITINEALEEGYISKFKIFNVEVEFTEEEAKEFKSVQRNYSYYENLLGGRFEAFTNSYKYLKDPEVSEDLKKFSRMYQYNLNKRKKILQEASNKIPLTKVILDLFPDRKAIIFCESIEFAERIDNHLDKHSIIYHSKLKKKDKVSAIKRFEDNRTNIRVLTSVKSLDQGLDVSGINLGICCAGSSKALQNIQRMSRATRKNESNTIAYYFNLYIKDTQEEKWLKSRCKDIPSVYWIETLNELT